MKGRRHQWGLIDTSLNYRPLPDNVFSKITGVRPHVEHVEFYRSNGRTKDSSSGLFNLADMRLELPCEYWGITPSTESIWVAWKCVYDPNQNRTAAFYDLKERKFISGWFKEAIPFSGGLGARRKTEAGRWNFVDKTLQPAFDGDFDGVEEFSHGLAAVYKDSDSGYIDTTGQMRLLLPHYDALQPFNEFGLVLANRDESEWDIDIIDRKGQGSSRDCRQPCSGRATSRTLKSQGTARMDGTMKFNFLI